MNLRVETVPWTGAIDPDDLSGPEQERLRTFDSAERRRQFVLGRLAARRLVGALRGEMPARVRLDVGEDGAPRIEAGHVSIAHAGRGFEAIGVAALADTPVGVDAEAIRPRHAGLARRILRPDEAGVLDALGGGSDTSLTLVWALKESVLKGQRTGLRAGAQSVRLVDVSLQSGHVAATSDRTGPWQVAFERRGAMWLAVATPREA